MGIPNNIQNSLSYGADGNRTRVQPLYLDIQLTTIIDLFYNFLILINK